MKKVKTVSALAVVISVLIVLLVFLFISNTEQVMEIESSSQENTAQESDNQSNVISALITKITDSLTQENSTPDTTPKTSGSSSGGSGSGGGKTKTSSNEMLSKEDAECIAHEFLCKIAACPLTVINSYLEGNYWKVEIRDDEENYTAILEINAYTGEIKE